MGISIDKKRAKKLAGYMFWAVAGSGCVYGCGTSIMQQQAEEKARADGQANFVARRAEFTNRLNLISRIRVDGQVYALTGPHTAETNDGGVRYIMNFKTRMVAIDGPGNADRIIGFDEMKHKAIIAEAHHGMCQVTKADSSTFPELRVKFSVQALNNRGAEVVNNRIAFAAAHCQPGMAL